MPVRQIGNNDAECHIDIFAVGTKSKQKRFIFSGSEQDMTKIMRTHQCSTTAKYLLPTTTLIKD